MDKVKEVLCICDFNEDGDQYWSAGCCYKVVGMDGDDYRIQNNFGGVGLIYAEDFDDYFKFM